MVATTVEQTAKPIKAARAVGCLSMPVGLFLLALGIADHSGGIITLGFLCTFGGLIAYVGAGALKWWRHE